MATVQTPDSELNPSITEPDKVEHSGTAHIWRPFFGSGYSRSGISHPRKRTTAGPSRTKNIKTILNIPDQCPTLVPARIVEVKPSDDDIDDIENHSRASTPALEENIRGTRLRDNKDLSNVPMPKNKRRSYHSFSIGDMFNSSSSGGLLSRTGTQKRKQNGNDETRTGAPVTTLSAIVSEVPAVGTSRSVAKSKGRLLQRRRNFTDPTLYHSESSQMGHSAIGRPDSTQLGIGASSPLSPLSHFSNFDIDLPKGTPSFPSTPFSDAPSDFSSTYRPVSSSHAPFSSRAKRVSLAASDPASTTFGSDNDTRVFTSGDEDSMEFQSDTAYDSLATRATASSHSGLRGPRIETIFDESPHSEGSKDLVPLVDLMGGRNLGGLAISMRKTYEDADDETKKIGVANEETMDNMEGVEYAHISTPVKRYTLDNDDLMPTPVPSKGQSLGLRDPSSSSPSVAATQVFHTQPTDHIRRSIEAMSIDGESDWDKATDQESTFGDTMQSPDLPRHSARRASPLPFQIHYDATRAIEDQRLNGDAEMRSSIFDWSEHQRSDKDVLNGFSPRPKTVHGKQIIDNRGSRAPGRRGPSGVHLRSQSVPVARETVMENDPTYPAAKFGTWGLGNKGVSEEWSDDFEFDDTENVDRGQTGTTESQGRAQPGMKVPQAIIDRQASVHGQFGQVQEFMLLVEELKRLRIQGAALQLLKGQSRHLWEDAENVINLATLNDEDDDLQPPRSPTSPNGFDDFDDNCPPVDRPRIQSNFKDPDLRWIESQPHRSVSGPTTPPVTRPRGESLAQVKSFLQTIHHNRNGADSLEVEEERRQQKKLPFDTEDLRDLVSRAGAVTRALKELVRKAEGVSLSPQRTSKKYSDPPFSQIFNRSGEGTSPVFTKPGLPKSRSANGYLGSSISSSNETTSPGT